MRRLRTAHRKKLLYLAVGGWNTVFGYDAFVALYALGRRLGWHYLAALAISQVLAILNAYVGYKLQDQAKAFILAERRGVELDLGPARRLVRRVDAREALELAAPGSRVQADD